MKVLQLQKKKKKKGKDERHSKRYFKETGSVS